MPISTLGTNAIRRTEDTQARKKARPVSSNGTIAVEALGIIHTNGGETSTIALEAIMVARTKMLIVGSSCGGRADGRVMVIPYGGHCSSI